MRDGEVVGTKNPTGHSLLVDCRFELPFGMYQAPVTRAYKPFSKGSQKILNFSIVHVLIYG